MIMRALLLAGTILAAAACSSESTVGDADAADGDPDGTDAGDLVDAADPPADPAQEDPAGDPPEDDTGDTGDDPDGTDAPGDTGEVEDPPMDPPEEEPDGDAADAVETDADCLPLEVSFATDPMTGNDDVEAWAICWMGIGTHVVFSLEYSNPDPACDVTGVTVTGESLRLSSDGSTIFSFGTTAPTGSFAGTVPAGSTVTVDYHASDGTLDGGGWDGSAVHVAADVTSSTGSVSLQSGSTDLYCVY